MDIQEKHFTVKRTTRYSTLGQPTSSLKQVWYLFHGYGQLASDIINLCTPLDEGSRFFIAPEGLSKFYISGSSGRVGASWMTREDRFNEIADYLNYLNELEGHISLKLPTVNFSTVLLGFSQGVATVCRWLENLSVRADRLILWAGTMPPEIDLWRIKAHYPSLEVFLVAGTQDRFVKSENIQEAEDRLERAELNYRKIRFDGKHELHLPTLQKLADF